MRIFCRLLPVPLSLLLVLGMVAAIGAAPDVPTEAAVHVVAPGETLIFIAEQYGVSASSLQEANDLPDPDRLAVGQRLIIPGLSPVSKGASQLDGASDAFTGRHVVAEGESLSRIAARYQTSVADLVRVNGLNDPDRVIVGQRLLVPGRESTAAEAGAEPQKLLEPFVRIEMRPDRPQQGDTVLVRVETSSEAVLAGRYEGKGVRFVSSGRQHWGLVPVHPMADVGPSSLTISAEVPDERAVTTVWPVWVEAGAFEVEDITLPPDRRKLLNRELILAENQRLAEALSDTGPSPLWQGLFSYPLQGPVVSSAFGTRRSYNGGPASSYHEGFDFDALAGDPVMAANDGRVVLAETLTVRGNAVLVDHGLGVHTGYWHLSEIDVQPGQLVKSGEVIGKVGSSGLSTGPHLHWEIRIEDVNVNPKQWTEQPFP